ncbi:MAG: T9SS type A sorting domain-containing protein [Deferribacteres bacterium]|nr:T9SS type A sorting domain-containing protein [Deferribacteres bacterium]
MRTDYIIISQPTGIVDSEDFQGEYKLFQNYPNPFNPSTILSFSLAEQGNANIKIYNLSGQVIQTVLNEYLSAGIHKVKWTPKDLPGGIYLSVLRVGQFTQTRKIMYVK